ncbi:MAG: hypothetical protein IT561_07825 [Alphaproteobacteria bacterium]|nr:hypothetical protein [Alphaproteobacteria bacterium]
MLRRIRLELARTKDFPEGSTHHGYEFVAPLTADHHLDAELWKKNRQVCTVHRFWPGEGDATGQLVRTRAGHWAFSYEAGAEDDEPIHRLEDHRFVEGEYVGIREHDGQTRPFKVTSIRPVPGLSPQV